MLEFAVHDVADGFLSLAVPNTAFVKLLWNQVSFAELEFDSDDRALANLAPGARVHVMWDGEPVLRGPVVNWKGTGPGGSTTVIVEDDFRVFRNLLWPKPDAAITAQTDEFKRYSGVTEAVVKEAAGDLADVLGASWSVAASSGAGSTQRLEVRFDKFLECVAPALEADKLTLTFNAGEVDVVEGSTFPRVLTEDTGVLGDYEWTIEAPTVTRVVVGGEGQGAARVLREYKNTPRETEWGFVSAAFVDSSLAEGVTDFTPDAAAAFQEGAAKVTVASDLIESDWFRFGKYKVGDLVHVQVGPVNVTEVIRVVEIRDDPDQGTVVVPSIGTGAASMDERLGRQVMALARGVRAQGRR